MQGKKILIIDDEKDIVELIAYNLSREGYTVEHAYDGETGLNKIKKTHYDLVVLDLMLPGIQGTELCKIIRNDPATSALPVIMVTAKSEEVDKIIGLEIGADDYICKPFSPRELTARVNAVLRRASIKPASDSPSSGIIKIKDMVIDKEKYTVTVKDKPIKLSATEFKLLVYLAERPNKIYSRDHLLDAVWGNDIYVEPRTVDVHIRRLRMKIEQEPEAPEYIKTMRGIGYFVELAE